MPSVADPISLYTAPGKGARHFFPTPNKADWGIQAIVDISIALKRKVRVTFT
jgi:hypothetical protein